MENDKKVEVREWLRHNKNDSPFASNIFDREEFEECIDDLYKLGIKEILVTDIYDEEDRIASEGGEYAATLLVLIPTNKEKILDFMLKIAKLNTDECDKEGKYLRLWWD